MTTGFRVAVVAALLASAAPLHSDSNEVTVTGWFSDEGCARARVKAGRIGPTGRACAQKSIAQGAVMVFIDEQAKRILRVANPEAAAGQESHYVRVAGSLDGDTLQVTSLEVLEEYAPSCGRPRKKK